MSQLVVLWHQAYESAAGQRRWLSATVDAAQPAVVPPAPHEPAQEVSR